jgi:hypothetical protein
MKSKCKLISNKKSCSTRNYKKHGVMNHSIRRNKRVDKSLKRGSLKRGSLKRGSLKRSSLKRGSLKRGSFKRGSFKRSSFKRGSLKRSSFKRGSLKRGMRNYFGLYKLENSMKDQVLTSNQVSPQNQELIDKQQDLQEQEKRAEELIITANLGGITLLGLTGLTGLSFNKVFKPRDRKDKEPLEPSYLSTSSKVKM